MATSRGNELARGIREKVEAFKEVCSEIDEATANRAPAGRWSPKEIVSHLCGPEGTGHLPILRAFVDKDTPTIELDAENPFFTEKRAQASFTELLSEFEREYERICKFAAELSEGQLERQAHVPMLTNSPLGAFPTLASMIAGLGEYHLGFHVDHMREILQELKGVASLRTR